jgi:hypothetical protein
LAFQDLDVGAIAMLSYGRCQFLDKFSRAGKAVVAPCTHVVADLAINGAQGSVAFALETQHDVRFKPIGLDFDARAEQINGDVHPGFGSFSVGNLARRHAGRLSRWPRCEAGSDVFLGDPDKTRHRRRTPAPALDRPDRGQIG